MVLSHGRVLYKSAEVTVDNNLATAGMDGVYRGSVQPPGMSAGDQQRLLYWWDVSSG